MRRRRLEPLSQDSQPFEGDAETGLPQASARATMGVTVAVVGTRDAGTALEEEWDTEGMRGRWTVVTTGNEGFGSIGSLGAETGAPHGRHRLSCSAVVARHPRAMATAIVHWSASGPHRSRLPSTVSFFAHVLSDVEHTVCYKKRLPLPKALLARARPSPGGQAR